jgi:hypothetical protein
VRPSRLALAALLLAAPALSGCFEIAAAHPTDAVLAARNWALNETASRSDASWGGLVRDEVRVYEHKAGGDGYAGTLTLATIRTFFAPSDGDLRDQLSQRVKDAAAANGIAIGAEAKQGSRTNAEGRSTVWFTYDGNATATGSVFTRNAEVRILGEVWNCPDDRTTVVAVGLAQVNDVQSLGGVAIPQSPDTRTWAALVADPKGTIEGYAGDGIVDDVACR